MRSQRLKSYPIGIWLTLTLSVLVSGFSSASSDKLETIIQQVETDSAPLVGYSIYVNAPQSSFSATRGNAAPKGNAITEAHVFRIASVTKTFTAATVLRLIEASKFNLDDAIAPLLDKEINQLLLKGGYPTSEITVRQLLNHTSGLFDHAQSADYLNQVMANPNLEWTRTQQLAGAVQWGAPIAEPGQKYAYSDTGYVLLGHIIEQTSGMSLPEAVRAYLNLDLLSSVVWEQGDTPAVPHDLRVHQLFEGTDTFNWNPTMDLYGGGGLIASPKDMAKFYSELFKGNVFDHKATLHLMLSHYKIPSRSPYRLGIFVKRYDEITVYEHGGFWGTLVMHDPTTQTTIAGAVIEAKQYKSLVQIMSNYLQPLHPTILTPD